MQECLGCGKTEGYNIKSLQRVTCMICGLEQPRHHGNSLDSHVPAIGLRQLATSEFLIGISDESRAAIVARCQVFVDQISGVPSLPPKKPFAARLRMLLKRLLGDRTTLVSSS